MKDTANINVNKTYYTFSLFKTHYTLFAVFQKLNPTDTAMKYCTFNFTKKFNSKIFTIVYYIISSVQK